MKYLYSFLLILLFSAAAFSQTGGYQVGQPIQHFSLSGPDGKTVSLADYAASKAVVVVFINQFCPNGRIYGKRLHESRRLTRTLRLEGLLPDHRK